MKDQCLYIAKRLFRAIDQESRKSLNKEETVEFVEFLREHLFHADYREERDRPQIEALFDTLPGQDFELKIPNPEYPDFPIIKKERRVTFAPLYKTFYEQARADGCIWIPFEETSPKKKPDWAELAEAGSRAELDKNKGS